MPQLGIEVKKGTEVISSSLYIIEPPILYLLLPPTIVKQNGCVLLPAGFSHWFRRRWSNCRSSSAFCLNFQLMSLRLSCFSQHSCMEIFSYFCLSFWDCQCENWEFFLFKEILWGFELTFGSWGTCELALRKVKWSYSSSFIFSLYLVRILWLFELNHGALVWSCLLHKSVLYEVCYLM